MCYFESKHANVSPPTLADFEIQTQVLENMSKSYKGRRRLHNYHLRQADNKQPMC